MPRICCCCFWNYMAGHHRKQDQVNLQSDPAVIFFYVEGKSQLGVLQMLLAATPISLGQHCQYSKGWHAQVDMIHGVIWGGLAHPWGKVRRWHQVAGSTGQQIWPLWNASPTATAALIASASSSADCPQRRLCSSPLANRVPCWPHPTHVPLVKLQPPLLP